MTSVCPLLTADPPCAAWPPHWAGSPRPARRRRGRWSRTLATASVEESTCADRWVTATARPSARGHFLRRWLGSSRSRLQGGAELSVDRPPRGLGEQRADTLQELSRPRAVLGCHSSLWARTSSSLAAVSSRKARSSDPDTRFVSPVKRSRSSAASVPVSSVAGRAVTAPVDVDEPLGGGADNLFLHGTPRDVDGCRLHRGLGGTTRSPLRQWLARRCPCAAAEK
jgi:hypothetical protein